jgi:hypothetical protein
MMVGACLVPLITFVLAFAPDATALVARLGSGSVVEREESAKALEAMGRQALPAIEAALRSSDSEVRTRLLTVWDRIQKGLLVRPTMVRLESGGRTLTEVVRSIGEQGGFSLVNIPQAPEHTLNVREPLPMPFWEAVDRLGLVGGRFDNANASGGRHPTLNFGWAEGDNPSTISGPFRTRLKGLHDHRDRTLIAGPWLRIDDFHQTIPIPARNPESEARFYLELGIMIEPRMWLTQEGPARAIEAVDDLGQSLVRRDAKRVEADHSVFYNGGGVTDGHFQLDLAMPDKPGRTIVRFRGSIPVALLVRRPVPDLEIALSAPKNKAFTHDDGVFTIREFRENDEATFIGVDVRVNLDRFDLPPRRDDEIVSSRLRCMADHQVDIVDADGNVLTANGGGNSNPDGSVRMSFMVLKNWTKARPARFRYFRMVRAFTDVSFEFRNIPLP